MSVPSHPRLRPTLTGHIDPDDQRYLWLYDSWRISRQTLRVHRHLLPLLERFDGSQSVAEIIDELRQSGMPNLDPEVILSLVKTLDEAVFLEGPRLHAVFEAFRTSTVREPACIGSYPGESAALHRVVDELYTAPAGPGRPAATPERDDVAGALIPHIDFRRGNVTYGWGFKEVLERTRADLFVILATSHYSAARFILTRKHFRTPLGVAETDQDFVQRLANAYGAEVFADEVAHVPEHSIEFHVVLLQHGLAKRRPFQIVPLLVGPFADCIRDGVLPHDRPDIRRMIDALHDAVAASGRKVCFLSSGDLAHIGPKFGDREPVREGTLTRSRQRDDDLLAALAQGDRQRFFDVLWKERDTRRICGFPPTYMLLSLVEGVAGQCMHYQQYVEPNGHESVSFASVVFHR
jgi:AmmeMemoRadiSam system protein B